MSNQVDGLTLMLVLLVAGIVMLGVSVPLFARLVKKDGFRLPKIKKKETAYQVIKDRIPFKQYKEDVENSIYFNKKLNITEKIQSLLEIKMNIEEISLLLDLNAQLYEKILTEINQINVWKEFQSKKTTFDEQRRDGVQLIVKNGEVESVKHIENYVEQGIQYLKLAYNIGSSTTQREFDLTMALVLFRKALQVDRRDLMAAMCIARTHIAFDRLKLHAEWYAKVLSFEFSEYLPVKRKIDSELKIIIEFQDLRKKHQKK
ncbi:MAG: hypothetical protein FK733_17360 [Asgard group archaeon]|nr:hypothetical protein [Asgard group archaeon]